MLTLFLIVLAVAFPASCLLTGLVRRYALGKGILDIPNARSSHSIPTPRGGGMAIAVSFLVGTALLALFGHLPTRLALALCGGGFLVAAVGWIDDKRGLSARCRLAAHFVAGVWAVLCLGGLGSLNVGFASLPLGYAGSLMAVIAIVWMINLYNFMDGIDGLASGEAVLVAGAASLLLWVAGNQQLSLLSFLLAASVAGFLVWNWPPARIFMGDVSSGLLGFAFGTLAIAGEKAGSLPALSWVLLLGVFVVDATATLVRRLIAGERLFDAHRTHAYQLAVVQGASHQKVSLTVVVINSLLGLFAWVANQRPALLLPELLLVFGALLFTWWRITQGRLTPTQSPKRAESI